MDWRDRENITSLFIYGLISPFVGVGCLIASKYYNRVLLDLTKDFNGTISVSEAIEIAKSKPRSYVMVSGLIVRDDS